jgi:hypothetical protein
MKHKGSGFGGSSPLPQKQQIALDRSFPSSLGITSNSGQRRDDQQRYRASINSFLKILVFAQISPHFEVTQSLAFSPLQSEDWTKLRNKESSNVVHSHQ